MCKFGLLGVHVRYNIPRIFFLLVGVGGVYKLISHLQCDGLRADGKC